MINEVIPGYLQEIPDTDWIQEMIGETFDGVLELMTPHSVVYGGAVRDPIAGLELVGDLDIAVSQQEFSEMSERIQTSPKWLPKDCSNYDPHEHEEGSVPNWRRITAKFGGPIKRGGSGDLARKLAPMSGVSEFIGANGREVQLITSKQHTKDPFQDALYMARMVDIICCAMVMTSDGRVFEVVPGAFQDCRDRILRLNDSSTTLFIEALPTRVAKLAERGWTNQIDVEKAMADVKKRQEQERKKKERRLLSARRMKSKGTMTGRLSSGIKVFNIRGAKGVEPNFPITGGETWELSAETAAKEFNNNTEKILDLAKYAARQAGVDITGKITPVGGVHFTARDYPKVSEFRSRFEHHLRQRKRRDLPRVRSEKKLDRLRWEAKQSGMMEAMAFEENIVKMAPEMERHIQSEPTPSEPPRPYPTGRMKERIATLKSTRGMTKWTSLSSTGRKKMDQ